MALSLLIVFALSMATATFVENDFGTQSARIAIYNAWWFELVMVLLGMNFIANTFRYNLYTKKKLPVLMFHLGFIIILIGAGITRYTGFEGLMRIREGETSNTIISDKNYFQLNIADNKDSLRVKKEFYFSPLNSNTLKLTEELGDHQITIDVKEFIADAQLQLLEAKDNEHGTEFIELVLSAGNGRETVYLKNGVSKSIGGHQHQLSFQDSIQDGIRIFKEKEVLKIESNESVEFFIMATQTAGSLEPGKAYDLQLNALYKFHDFSFVVVKHLLNGVTKWSSVSKKPKENKDNIDDIVLVSVSVNDKIEEVPLLYKHGHLPEIKSLAIDNVKLKLAYGALPYTTDFSVKLRDFQLEKYPGSTSPSSYASEVTVIDEGNETDYRIFMNNVLDYKGFRFFQASYDTDEKGTVLAINKDRPGTILTYIGYILMGLGMFFTLFTGNSRFGFLRKKLNQIKAKHIAVVLLLLNMLFLNDELQSQNTSNLDSIMQSQVVDKAHAALFGKLLVQDLDGRIKPINTLASEFIRKVSRKNYYAAEGIKLDANQLFIAIHKDPSVWSNLPLIKIDKNKGGVVFDEITTNGNSLASFNAFLDADNNYILEEYIGEANEKKPGERNEFDKEIIKVDERFNLVFNVLSGNYLKIFPKRDDPSQTWYGPNHGFTDFEEEDARFAKGIIPLYFLTVEEAKGSKDWSDAEDKIAYIKKYQEVLASDIIPSSERIEAELWYNDLNLNFWLFQAYFILGLLLLGLSLLKIFYDKASVRGLINVMVIFTLVAFLIQTFNLILRWYVAEHPPWSNGYEMLIFVSWSLLFFGIFFYKKSDFTLPLASIFSGTLLFVSYLDWLSPEITNLMPVLKSYWLKIHVATIISSYAPLALSALLGLMAQLLILVKSKKNEKIIQLKIKEITYINEMSMTIGLFVLSIGTFLGGVWANESWGRYWAWDPKETWALISIIVYAIVLHLRLVPKLSNVYSINMVSTFAFSSIVMTSFGVNYYLTGLHSYATGDPVPIPIFVYISIAVMVVISSLSYMKFKRDQKEA